MCSSDLEGERLRERVQKLEPFFVVRIAAIGGEDWQRGESRGLTSFMVVPDVSAMRQKPLSICFRLWQSERAKN